MKDWIFSKIPGLFYILTTAVALILFIPSASDALQKVNVLVIHSYGEGLSWTEDIDRGIRSTFKQKGINVNYYFEYLHSKRFAGESFFERLAVIFRQKYENLDFDVIISVDDRAFQFLASYGKDIFPKVPVVFCGINDQEILGQNTTGIAAGFVEKIDIRGTLDDALKVHPDASRVILINDNTNTGKILQRQAEQDLASYRDYLDFVELYDLSEVSLRSELKSLDSLPSIILFFAYYRTPGGRAFSTGNAFSLIGESSPWPVYSFWDFTLQEGPFSALGGRVLSGETLGQKTALAALEILSGKVYPPGSMILDSPEPELTYSYPRMKDFGISEEDLPSGSTVLDKPPSFFSLYSELIMFNLLFFMSMGFLFAVLSIVIIRRKRVERDLVREKKFWENLFNLSPEGIIFTDMEDRITKVNQKFCDLFGYREKDISGKPLAGLFAKNRQQFEEALLNTNRIKDSRGFEIETVRTDRNNRDISILLIGVPLIIQEEHRLNLWIYRDITGLKKAEAEIVHRLDFEELLSSMSSRMVFIQNMDRTVLEVIEELRKFLGCSAVFLARMDRGRGTMRILQESLGRGAVSLEETPGGLRLADWARITKEIREKGHFIYQRGNISGDLDLWLSELFVNRAVKSLLILPMKMNESEFEGFIGFENIWLYRNWDSSDLNFLKTFSDLLGEAYRRVERNEKLQNTMTDLQKTFDGTFRTITKMLEIKDPYTTGHQMSVTCLATAIAREMGLQDDFIEGLYYASLVHDIGKINIPGEILTKPVRLSEAEFALIKNHARYGWEILKDIQFPWPIAEIVLQHHERMDGSGYPRGLKGDQILLEARIITVADVVEAMSSDRPYRPSLGIASALEEISTHSGDWFMPEAVEACITLFRERHFTFPGKILKKFVFEKGRF